MDIIEKYPDKPWDWWYVSRNQNITMEFIENHLEKPWNWFWISSNPNITIDIIEKHPDKPWDWKSISMNSNLTIEFIEKHLEKINFDYLSKSKFTFQNSKIKQNQSYLLLEKELSFHKLQNLYIITQYL
jgi:hypothetical protein